jgi:hypothetical protein
METFILRVLALGIPICVCLATLNPILEATGSLIAAVLWVLVCGYVASVWVRKVDE